VLPPCHGTLLTFPPFLGICIHSILQKCLAQDDILGFLEVVLEGMHNIPYDTISRIRWFKDHIHSMVHVLLWLCCPSGVDFDSGSKNQIGILDIVIVTRNFHHYLELKAEEGDSATEAVQQIAEKHYSRTFPGPESPQQKPAFHYGIKWTDKSTHATVEVRAEGTAVDTDLWKDRLSTNPHTVCVP
jgi:hypothetical protein